MLGLAGINTPDTMDGKSIVPLVVDKNDEKIPLSVKLHIENDERQKKPKRDFHFTEYYNQGPWDPAGFGKNQPKDDWSNTYIGLMIRNETVGNWKYGEYDPYGK